MPRIHIYVLKYTNPYSAEINFRRQKIWRLYTLDSEVYSTHVYIFWRIKSIPALYKSKHISNGRRPIP